MNGPRDDDLSVRLHFHRGAVRFHRAKGDRLQPAGSERLVRRAVDQEADNRDGLLFARTGLLPPAHNDHSSVRVAGQGIGPFANCPRLIDERRAEEGPVGADLPPLDAAGGGTFPGNEHRAVGIDGDFDGIAVDGAAKFHPAQVGQTRVGRSVGVVAGDQPAGNPGSDHDDASIGKQGNRTGPNAFRDEIVVELRGRRAVGAKPRVQRAVGMEAGHLPGFAIRRMLAGGHNLPVRLNFDVPIRRDIVASMRRRRHSRGPELGVVCGRRPVGHRRRDRDRLRAVQQRVIRRRNGKRGRRLAGRDGHARGDRGLRGVTAGQQDRERGAHVGVVAGHGAGGQRRRFRRSKSARR